MKTDLLVKGKELTSSLADLGESVLHAPNLNRVKMTKENIREIRGAKRTGTREA